MKLWPGKSGQSQHPTKVSILLQIFMLNVYLLDAANVEEDNKMEELRLLDALVRIAAYIQENKATAARGK